MNNDNDDNMSEEPNLPTHYEIAFWTTMLGSFAILIATILAIIYPTVNILDQPSRGTLTATYFANITVPSIFLLLDTIFIIGYTSMFISFWRMTRDILDIMSMLALILSLITSSTDFLENAMYYTIITQETNPPANLLYFVYSLNAIIDLSSYLAALLFAIIFLRSYNLPYKRIVGFLLLIYSAVGMLAMVIPRIYLLRRWLFVIGLAYASVVFYYEEEYDIEELQEILHSKSSSKSDFIR